MTDWNRICRQSAEQNQATKREVYLEIADMIDDLEVDELGEPLSKLSDKLRAEGWGLYE